MAAFKAALQHSETLLLRVGHNRQPQLHHAGISMPATVQSNVAIN
jgi:hypothetical protein